MKFILVCCLSILLSSFAFGQHQHNEVKAAAPKKNPQKTSDIETVGNNKLPGVVRYDLYIADTTVTFGGKAKRAIAVNGQIQIGRAHV